MPADKEWDNGKGKEEWRKCNRLVAFWQEESSVVCCMTRGISVSQCRPSVHQSRKCARQKAAPSLLTTQTHIPNIGHLSNNARYKHWCRISFSCCRDFLCLRNPRDMEARLVCLLNGRRWSVRPSPFAPVRFQLDGTRHRRGGPTVYIIMSLANSLLINLLTALDEYT